MDDEEILQTIYLGVEGREMILRRTDKDRWRAEIGEGTGILKGWDRNR